MAPPRSPGIQGTWAVAAALALGVLAVVLAQTAGPAAAFGTVAGVALVLLVVHLLERRARGDRPK